MRNPLPTEVQSYLADVDSDRMLEALSTWRLPVEPLRVLVVSAFADVFIEGPGGAVWRLDSTSGDARAVAPSPDAFWAIASEHLDDWFRAPLVRAVVATGLMLPGGSVYAVPLTDEVAEPARVRVAEAALHLQVLGQMFALFTEAPASHVAAPNLDGLLQFDDEWRRHEQLFVTAVRRVSGRVLEEGEVFVRVDFRTGLLWAAASEKGPALACATARVIGTFARSDNSYRAASLNSSFPTAVALPLASANASAIAHPCTAADASQIALAAGIRASAEHVYSHRDIQHVVFVAIFALHASTPADAPWPPAPSPWPFVRQHMSEMLDELKRGGDLRALMRNRGAVMENDELRRGTAWEEPLRRLGRKLIVAADESIGRQRLALLDVRASAERYETEGA